MLWGFDDVIGKELKSIFTSHNVVRPGNKVRCIYTSKS